MGECLEEALLFQIIVNIMKKKRIVEKIKRWVCSDNSTFYGPRFVTHQPMIEKVPQILVFLVLATPIRGMINLHKRHPNYNTTMSSTMCHYLLQC